MPKPFEAYPYWDLDIKPEENGDVAEILERRANALSSPVCTGYDPSKFTNVQAVRTLRQVVEFIRSRDAQSQRAG